MWNVVAEELEGTNAGHRHRDVPSVDCVSWERTAISSDMYIVASSPLSIPVPNHHLSLHFSAPKSLIFPPIPLNLVQQDKRIKMSLEARLQAASTEYQKLQIDYSNAVEARQKLDAQLSENELVKKVRLVLYFFP